MATRPDDAAKVTASMLDRLLDDDLGRSQDPPKSGAQELRELRESVLRDVANLLNTRRRWPVPDASFDELAMSLADYGIPDFTGADLSTSKAREGFRIEIENALRRHEPRFKSVSVELLSNDDSGDRTLHFRVDALLHADPAPEVLSFDSFVDPVSGGFDVEGGDA